MSSTNQLIESIDNVIESIQDRKDYKTIKFKDLNDDTLTVSASEVVALFNQFKQSFLLLLTTQKHIPQDLQNKVIKTINIIIQSNQSMIQEGQLDLNRTIKPTSAKEENIALEKLKAVVKMS